MLCHGLWVDVDVVLTVFKDFLSTLLGGATIFAKLLSKTVKCPEIGEKVCAPHFV